MVEPLGIVRTGFELKFTRPYEGYKKVTTVQDVATRYEDPLGCTTMDLSINLGSEVEEFEFPSLMQLYHTTNKLGGAATTPATVQIAHPLQPISGVRILASLANEVGVGKLIVEKTDSAVALTWIASGALKPIRRLITSSGGLELKTDYKAKGGALLLDINYFRLVEGEYDIFVENRVGELIESIPDTQGLDGAVMYYGFVLKNISRIITFSEMSVNVNTQPISGVEILAGLGVVRQVQNKIPDRFTPPANINFSKTAKVFGLSPTASVALWLKVSVPKAAIRPLDIDLGRMIVRAKL